jgi:ferritin-like metal-binding protein YciE
VAPALHFLRNGSTPSSVFSRHLSTNPMRRKRARHGALHRRLPAGKETAMSVDSLESLFLHELKDVYSAEQQILKALPKLIKAVKASELAAALKEHLAATKVHAERLQQVLKAYGAKPGGLKCKGMEGVLSEGDEILEEEMPAEVRDAAIISAAQRVEHYEMAAYGCLRTYAKVLGDLASAQLLQTTLDEEADADRKLTQLAEFSVNARAVKSASKGAAEPKKPAKPSPKSKAA